MQFSYFSSKENIFYPLVEIPEFYVRLRPFFKNGAEKENIADFCIRGYGRSTWPRPDTTLPSR